MTNQEQEKINQAEDKVTHLPDDPKLRTKGYTASKYKRYKRLCALVKAHEAMAENRRRLRDMLYGELVDTPEFKAMEGNAVTGESFSHVA